MLLLPVAHKALEGGDGELVVREDGDLKIAEASPVEVDDDAMVEVRDTCAPYEVSQVQCNRGSVEGGRCVNQVQVMLL